MLPVVVDTTIQLEVEISEVNIRRDFNRETHEYDPPLLVRGYKFCRQYQNGVCTYTECKYVHATILEEQHFYRTGILPQHLTQPQPTLTPLPRPLRTRSLPPPPKSRFLLPSPLSKEHPTNFSTNTNDVLCDDDFIFTNPPPPLENEPPQETIITTAPPRSESLKRKWSSIEPCTSSPSYRDNNEPFAKKCKYCNIMGFRLRCNKRMAGEMLLAKHVLNKKLFTLEEQFKILRALISEFLKSH